MKVFSFLGLVLVSTLPGCSTHGASITYGVAADVKKSECRKFAEPRSSECLNKLERELDRQEALAEEIERERSTSSPSRNESLRERLEGSVSDGS